ncbi:prenylated rab acceptor PRA1 [Phakopsora pachyrhizi]|uniref:PRA1 family protein n=1 Tax=Phakopsora pachyrhizi TaxID=170000 RepID=A0AAV0AQC3_PHAPC|nr:prenylated rab acceptor PRA1 [Phakopsora pachyrhizi]CAH7669779.1 prenylated rab acceptor PRA1 [Phakopsora pachyrhizi]
MAMALAMIQNVPQFFSSFREQRLSSIRPVSEFLDYQRVSRPKDLNEATSRITHNTRQFSGNYAVIVALLAVYSLLTNPLLLIAIGFLVGGFACIQRFGPNSESAAEGQVVTQKNLYIGLFVIGIPMLWIAAPISTAMWLVGSSAVTVLGHASFLEPSVVSN